MRAMSEIQNPLSAIATLSAIFSRSDTFSPALMFSLDEVSVLMNDNFNEKPTVMLSKEIFDFFEKEHISPGSVSSEPTDARRCVRFSCLNNAAGELVHTAIKIIDDEFEDPTVFSISDQLSIWYLPPNYDKVDFFRTLSEDYILPVIQEKRKEVIYAKENPSLEHGISMESNVRPAHSFPRTDKYDYITENMVNSEPAVLTMDGAIDQVAATIKSCANVYAAIKCSITKWSAASSGVQQPADVGNMHQSLKSSLRKTRYF
jgi:hypothetical protein